MYVGSGLQEALFNRQNLAIQGELMGPGIQGNREDFKATQFFVFDIQDLNTGEYLTPTERVVKMGVLGCVPHVPVLHVNVTLAELGITNVDELLKYAEGKSINHQVREGLVFKRMDGKFSFKAISNRFLEKEKD
jgi:ATP-dependent RNA circularization protein (DNA/RNA ligase family)